MAPQHDPLSPELALVDPELARRFDDGPREVDHQARSMLDLRVVPLPPAARSRPRTVCPAIVAAPLVAAVLLLVLGGVEHRSSSEALVVARSAPSEMHRAPIAGVTKQSGGSVPTTPASASDPQAPSSRPAETGDPAARLVSSTGAVAPTRTELVWLESPRALSYDVELVRDGRSIYSIRTREARLELPREWKHQGRAVQVRPEDQVYVWRVEHGRRAGRPVVDGRLALDMTPVARATG